MFFGKKLSLDPKWERDKKRQDIGELLKKAGIGETIKMTVEAIDSKDLLVRLDNLADNTTQKVNLEALAKALWLEGSPDIFLTIKIKELSLSGTMTLENMEAR